MRPVSLVDKWVCQVLTRYYVFEMEVIRMDLEEAKKLYRYVLGS